MRVKRERERGKERERKARQAPDALGPTPYTPPTGPTGPVGGALHQPPAVNYLPPFENGPFSLKVHLSHPGGNPGANFKSTSHRCHLFEVAFSWGLMGKNIYVPLGCLPGRSVPSTGIYILKKGLKVHLWLLVAAGGMGARRDVQGYVTYKKMHPPRTLP